MKKDIISPARLKELRDRHGWSQQELASKSKVTSRTILSIEKSAEEQVSTQHKTLTGLAKALGVRPDVLSGTAPVPEEGQPHDLHVRLSPQVRLNFDLIKEKYRVDITDIINVAPLLFVMAAEESLQRQQESLEHDAKEYAKSQILPDGPIPDEVESYFASRWDAVKNNDLFVDYWEDPSLWNDDVMDESPELPRWAFPNPFADFLYEVSKRPLLKGTVELMDEVELAMTEREFGPRYEYSRDGECIPDHRVCLDILDRITLGSDDAKNALVRGVVRISDIPRDLWAPRKAGERVAWLEDVYRGRPDVQPPLFSASSGPPRFRFMDEGSR